MLAGTCAEVDEGFGAAFTAVAGLGSGLAFVSGAIVVFALGSAAKNSFRSSTLACNFNLPFKVALVKR